MNSNDKKSKDNIIKRIKKCLAIAGDSAATSNEAATALRQAQALMREYDLSMIDVENADFKITQEFMKMARQQPKWKRYLFSSIAKAFGVVKGNLKCYIKLFLYVKFYKFTNLQFT